MELCVKGEASLSDIDDFIDTWHGGAGKASLREYLGLSESEYALWINEPDELARILASRKTAAL
jgi:hypothetical protein